MTQISFPSTPDLPPAIPYNPAAVMTGSPYKTRRKQRRFSFVYLAALLIAFSPSKELGLVGPFIIIAALVFYVQLRPNHHLGKLTLVALIFVLVGSSYWLLLPQFAWPNYFLIAVTSSAAIFLLFDFTLLLDVPFMRRLGKLTLIFIFLQSVYGIGQFILAVATLGYSGIIGDNVWGTLAPPNQRVYAGTSPFFVLLISTLLLFAIGLTKPRLSFTVLIGLLTVAFCWMLASLLHSVVFMVVAIIAALVCISMFKRRSRQPSKRSRRGVFIAVILVIVLVGAGILVHPSNYQRIDTVLRSIREFGPDAKFGKVRAFYDIVIEVPQTVWFQPLIGLGPGQYSSRAALIATGEYLSRASIPLLPDYTSELTERYVMPLLYDSNSSTHSPASSWIAVYSELGIMGWSILLLLLFYAVRRFSRFVSPEFPRMSLAMVTLVFYVFLMGFQNVYWEYTQGIFPAILVLKIAHDFVRPPKRARQVSRAVEKVEQAALQPMIS